VYFALIPDGRVKIGVTDDFITRRSMLGRAFGRPVVLLAIIPGWEETEKAMHRRFKACRAAKSELFTHSLAIVEFLESYPGPIIRSFSEVRDKQKMFNDSPREPRKFRAGTIALWG
jgi:hypothetical protein